MRLSSMELIWLAILCVCWPISAEELTKEELAARDFSFQGVGIGTTREDFLKKFPNAQLQAEDKTNLTPNYLVALNGGQFLGGEFFEGRLYVLSISFPEDMLEGVGGKPVFERKLTDTFGSSPSKVNESYCWEFPNVSRRLAYSRDDSVTLLCLVDTAANERRISAQASKLDIGF